MTLTELRRRWHLTQDERIETGSDLTIDDVNDLVNGLERLITVYTTFLRGRLTCVEQRILDEAMENAMK